MSVSLLVNAAEILTLMLLGLLGGQICRLWRVDQRPAVSSQVIAQSPADLSGQPDVILADYIGELMAGTQAPLPELALPDRVPVVPPPADIQPKPLPSQPEATARPSDYPSVAALLAHRCDTSSA
ncbi:hypothetical protein [Marinobacter sp. NFXS9]|uniref:hypothetical protein n=1 Tax=Marinobacter sp. NFXS9 TaxID=2818433 RepID=UPI0032DF1E9F